MTKSKGIDPAVQAISAIQNAMMILSNRVTARGGSLTEALVRLGKGEARYENSLNLIAGELAAISGAPKKATEITSPLGGRVHTLLVAFDESIHWGRAIRQGFPDTNIHSEICDIGGQYPLGGRPYATHKIVLVNFGESIAAGDKNTVRLWGLEHNLIPVNPRVIWAIGEQFPNLHRPLQETNIVVMTLMECQYHDAVFLPFGCWNKFVRQAGLGEIITGPSNERWFAFEEEDLSV